MPFQVGQVVWAKVKGHQNWPARIITLEEYSQVAVLSRSRASQNKKVPVKFFGREIYGLVSSDALQEYAETRSKVKKVSASLMKALQEADEAIAQEQDKPTLDLPSNMELSEDAQSTICTTTTSNSGEEKVYGILGLGLISQLILKQILTNGYRCIVWDIEPLRGNIKLSDERISIANTPGEVIRNSRIIFSFVDFDVKMMIYGNDGVLTSIDSTKGYVEMSYIDRFSSKEISASIEGKGARYIEAGTIYFPGILEKAQGITIMAGNRSLFDECSPLFDSTSSKIFYLGPVVGLATLEKTFISSLCNIMTSAMGESFRIVRQANLNVETFTEIAQICLNHQMERSFELLLNQQEIPLQKMIKEQQYMQREASNYLVSLPITAIATQSLLAMSDQKNVEYNRKD